MSPIQITVQELKEIVYRRKTLLVAIPIIITIIGITASYLITPKYKSSISILVQKKQTLNPLVLYDMAVDMANDDRLTSFNEIVYSRETIKMLIDSLDLDQQLKYQMREQELIEKVQKDIHTTFRGSDSFKITYFDTDPKRAQEGARILADHFIKTRLSLENRRNEQTVDFFETKIKELEKAVKKRQETLLSLSKKRIEQSPIDKTALNQKLQDIERQIGTVEARISELRRVLKQINNISHEQLTDREVERLYSLPLNNVPMGGELKSTLEGYDQFMRNYTKEYPGYDKIERKVFGVLNRIPQAMKSEIKFKNLNIKDLRQQRKQVLNALEKNAVSNRIDEVKKADYGIYRELYDKMKVKLEHARTTRDLGRKTQSQFVVIDPPYYPKEPSSPNRLLIIAASFCLGVFIAMVAAAGAELFDTVVRKEEDIEDFDIPVIAYISDGT